MTTEAYVRDPRFEVIGAAVKVGNAPAVWMDEADFRRWVATVDWSQCACLAQNCAFDGSILAWHYGVKPKLWIDTLSMARALHPETGGSLEKLAIAYGVGAKGHEVENAKGKRRKDFTLEEWLRYGEYSKNDIELTYAILAKMRESGFPDSELLLIDTTLRMFTEPTFIGDTEMLSQFLTEERARKIKLLAEVAGIQATPGLTEEQALAAAKKTLGSNDKLAALLRSRGIEPPTKISPATGNEIYAFAKSDPGMQELLEHADEDIRLIAEARLAIKSTIDETRTERFLSCASRGPMPVLLKYAGAHTLRWSGGGGMNFQNLRRGGVLRDSLMAPPGYAVVVADSGQIEARVVAWLAGQENLLEAFRRNDGIAGGDFYSDAGSVFFGKKLSKKETPTERQIAKGMILGLGFGMGWPKFAGELLKGLLGSPPVQFTIEDAAKLGVEVNRFRANPRNLERVRKMVSRLELDPLIVHCAVAAHLVYKYRAENEHIAGFWELCGEALETMVADESGSGTLAVFGPGNIIAVQRHRLMLPTGMPLRYPGLKRDENGFVYYDAEHRMHKRVYGGLLTENIVQRVARDIVAGQMLQLRFKHGYHVATSTHDEAVLMVPEAQAEQALAHAIAEMRTSPTWAAGLPLNAEGGVGKRYGDAK